MSDHIVKRGFVSTDSKEFNEESLVILKKAQEEIFWLINRGYSIKNASTFVGNHYLLSERQRLALVRATSTTEMLRQRQEKCLTAGFDNQMVFIDGLNVIISLEVALSESTLIYCMDQTIRDLAGLRGTYHIIDKTLLAIKLIGDKLRMMNIKGVTFYLDAPVSNTGRLKQTIQEQLAEYPYHVNVELVNNADVLLENKEFVITSDSIILNKCISWINLVTDIIKEDIEEAKLIDLGL